MKKTPRPEVSIENTVLLGPEDVVNAFDLILNPGEHSPGIPHPWMEVGADSFTVGRQVKKMPAYSFRRPVTLDVSADTVSSFPINRDSMKALPV